MNWFNLGYSLCILIWLSICKTPCRSVAKEASQDYGQTVPDSLPHSNESQEQALVSSGKPHDPPSSLFSTLNTSPAPEIDPSRLVERARHFQLSTEEYIDPSAFLEVPSFDLTAFIEQLHVVCVHQGYLALADPSINRLQRPLTLLFSIMDRESLTSYFEAALHSKGPLEQWSNMPFFPTHGTSFILRSIQTVQ